VRVVFFPKGDAAFASSRYRCHRVAEELRRQGCQAEVCDPPPRSFDRRFPKAGVMELWRLHRSLMTVGRNDILYLQRPLQSRPFVVLAVAHQRLRRLRMVFDFCDPVHLRAPGKTRFLARAADMVVVSCEDLAAYARQYNSNVHVIPNSVLTTEIADDVVAHRGSSPVVGWVGDGRVHRGNLELLIEPFTAVAAHTPFVFRIVGARGISALLSRFQAIPGLTVDAIDWLGPEDVREVIRGFDVAVLPLLDTEWQRKLVTKLIEYMAAGVPVLASPVGDNRFILVDGKSGSLASTPAEWSARLSTLLGAPELRRALALEALRVVHERFRLDTNTRRLAGLLHGLSIAEAAQ